MIDTKKLREIASKAKGVGVFRLHRCSGSGSTGDLMLASAHIDAFNPTTALELLDRIDKLEEQLEHYKELSQELADSCNHVADERSAAVARIARLEADNAKLRDALQSGLRPEGW